MSVGCADTAAASQQLFHECAGHAFRLPGRNTVTPKCQNVEQGCAFVEKAADGGLGCAERDGIHECRKGRQGIARLAPGLRVEATAPDGLVEAVSLPSASAFFLAVQWHPEWQVREDPFYLATFAAFGQACRERARRRSSTDED